MRSKKEESAVLAGRSWMYRANIGHINSFAVCRSSKQGRKQTRPKLGSLTPIARDLSGRPTTDLFQSEIIPVNEEDVLSRSAMKLSNMIRTNVTPAALKYMDSSIRQEVATPVQGYAAIDPSAARIIKELPKPTNDPTYKGYFRKGVKEFSAHQFRNARDAFQVCRRSQADSENRTVVCYNLSLSLYCLGVIDQAIEAITEGIRLSGHDKRYLLFRSILHRTQGNYILAGHDLDKIHALKKTTKHHALADFTRKRSSLWGRVKDKKNVSTKHQFDALCRTEPKTRTAEQLEGLISLSREFIPFFSKLDDNVLHILWRNLTHHSCVNDQVIHMDMHDSSLYIALTGTFQVLTTSNGTPVYHNKLSPGGIFSRASVATNIWREAHLITQTHHAEYLTLDDVVYKVSLKNIFAENAVVRSQYLTSLNVFKDWTSDEMKSLGVVSEELELGPNTTIVREGESATHLYFIMNGSASVVRSLVDTNIQLCTLSSGDVFGENAVLDPINGKIPASIVSRTRVKVIRIDREVLNRHSAFNLLRLGQISSGVVAQLKFRSVRLVPDKQLVQMIKNKCSWEKTRRTVIKQYLQDTARARGESGPHIDNISVL